MISKKTEKYIRYILNPGAKYGILRFYLESTPHYQYVLLSHRKWSIAYSAFSIFVITGLVALLGWRALFGRLLIPDAIFSVAVMAPLLFCLMSQLFLLFHLEEVLINLNQWFIVIQSTCTIFKKK